MSLWDSIKSGAKKLFSSERAEKARQQKMTGGNTKKVKISNPFTTPSSSQARQQKLWGTTRTTTNHSNVVQSVLNKPKTSGSSQQLPINNGQTYNNYAKYNRNTGRNIFTTIRNQIKRANEIDYSNFFGNGYGYAKAAEDAQRLGEELQGRNLTMAELGHNAAMLHTGEDTTQIKSHLIDEQFNQRGLHDNIIGWGQQAIMDQDAVNKWILDGGTDEEMKLRLEQVNHYFGNAGRTGNAFNIVDTFDPETKEYVKQSQIREDAPLPPWITPNQTNLEWWEYYKQYSHDVVQATADAYLEAKEEARVQKVNPYKSAFANSTDPDAINSFSDVLIDAIGAEGGISGKYEKLARGTATYLNEYVINPIKEGHFLTAGGNAVYNMMETMDIAARGVRAFTAGDQALGGAGGTWSKTEYHFGDGTRGFLHTSGRNNDAKFEGQDVYWANIEGHDIEDIKKAQRLFMDNGGYALLLGANQNEATKAQLGSGGVASRPEERAEIVRRLDTLFAGSDINWRLIYDDINKNYFSKDKSVKDLKRGIENVKESYTDRNAMFNADTGSLAADMVIEMALDPGLLVGGGAKAAAGGAVNTAARTGVEEGFKAILRISDDAAELANNKAAREALKGLTNNKNIQKALKGLINSNEGKNIIFKHADKFDEDLQLFIKIVKANDDTIFSTKAAEDTFKNVVTSHLMGKNRSINGMIIGSVKDGNKTVWGTHFAREALDTKAFKAAYYLDKAVDGVDSAIIKSSFFLPWAGVKGVKMGINTIDNVMHTPTVSKAMARLGLDKSEAARAIVDEMTQEVDVTKVKNLLYKADANEVKKSYVKNALQFVVKEQDDVARDTNSILNSFIRGEINADDALKLVEDSIGKITAGRYKSVDDFKAFIDNLAPKYTSDVKRSFDRINKNYDKLKNAIDRRSEDRVVDFLERVRQVKDADELKVLFREHMDNAFIRDLRDEVVDAAPFSITSDEVGAIVDDIRLNGLFAETTLDKNLTDIGIEGIKKSGAKTVHRTVSFDEFDRLLKKDLGIDWKKIDLIVEQSDILDNPPEITTLERYVTDFMRQWSKNDSITYNIQDAIKIVDKFERKIHFNVLMNYLSPVEASAIKAHSLVGEFTKLRQSLKKIDVISLKDAKVVTLLHTDRMAYQQEIIRSKDIQHMYGEFYNDVIAPMVDVFRGKTTDEIDLMDSALFDDVSELAKQKYGYDRTSQLVDEARYLAGFSDEQLHSFINTLATDFKFTDDIGNIDLAPGMLRKKVEATFRAQMGDSKIGKKNMLDILQSANSDQPNPILEPYMDELTKAHNKTRYDAIVNKDILDPSGDVERQMIFAALADPTIVDEWNAAALKGEPPVFMHVNSTGLNSEINSISSVSLRKWVPIKVSEDSPLTLEKLLDALDAGETKVFQRYMSDSEIDGVSEQVLRRLDMKGLDISELRKVYKSFYGMDSVNSYKSELDVLEEVSDFLINSSVTKEGADGLRLASPSLIVHDLDGFNISYLNDKMIASRNLVGEDSKVISYLDNLSNSAQRNSYNTYHRLASMVGDSNYTADQIDRMTTLLQDYIDDINQFAKGYRFNDVRSYSRKLSDIIERIQIKMDGGISSEYEERFYELYRNADGGVSLSKYNDAVRHISNLSINPRGYAFITSDLDDNIVKSALREAGRTSVNVDTRIYVDDVLSYFALDTVDGFNVNVEDLQKMHEMSQYIIKTRDRQIVVGAEEFLIKHKEAYDNIIQSCIDLANSNSWEATQLSYLQNMRIPDTAVESYLMVKKLYNDHLKYWLDTDSVTNLHRDGKSLDAMKMRLMEEVKITGQTAEHKLKERQLFEMACDYVNNNRRRMMDELSGGGFNAGAYEDYLELEDEFQDTISEFWADYSAQQKKIWDDFKEFNSVIRDNYSEKYDNLNKSFEDWKTDKEYAQYLYADLDEKRTAYRELKDANDRLYNELLDVFDDSDPRWADYKANIDRMEDMREEIQETWKHAHENYEAYKQGWFDEGKFKLKGKSKALKAEREKAKAGALHPGWGRKTTKRQIRKSVYDRLNGTAMDIGARREAFESIDNASKEASRLLSQGKDYEAGQVLFNAIDDVTKDLKWIDDEAYNASKDLRYTLRHNSVNIDSVKGDIADFDKYRKTHFGSLKFTKGGASYDQFLADTLIPEYPEYFLNYDGEGPSGLYEYIDDILENTKIKQVDYSNEEKAFIRDGLLDDVLTTLQSRPGYSVSDADDNFTEVYNRYVYELKRPTDYDGVKALSETEHLLAQQEYMIMVAEHRDTSQAVLDEVRLTIGTSDEALDILEGAHAPEIYNWAAKSDYEKNILKYKDGVLSEGIDAATRYSEANSEIVSNLRQLNHIDDVYVRNGLGRKQDRLTASVYMKAKQLFDILEQTKIAKRESFQDFINKATEINNMRVQQARYKSLLTDGKLDRNKLISEVLWNDFNMTVFNTHNYYDEEISELSNFIKKLQDNGDDFLSYYEDKSTGNVYVYLNTKAGKVSDADDGFRYINGSERFARPVRGVTPLADFDELAEILDFDDLEDFRGVYSHLRSCWEDTRLLSSGQINGTTGRTVSRKQAEEFLASLPSSMNDYLTSQGLLQFETMRGVVYDPGFVRSDSADILTDYLDTLKHQADVAKDDCVLIREVFTKEGDNLQFSDLAQNFTDDELLEYFGKSSDYVVCTIQAGGNTATGLQIRQVNMGYLEAVHRARYMENTTILPYDMYYELSNYMNRSASSSPVKRMLGKYLVAYKAFALVKPGTWMRNYIDATTKAALDSEEGVLSGFAQMIQYEMQAIRNIGTYMKILKSDPSLLTKSNWDIIQRSFGTDMPFEDFQLLRGILDGNDRFTSASKYFVNDTAIRRAGHNVISGENIGLRNLDEEGFEEAFKKYLSKEIDLPLSKEEFKAIYFGQTVPDEVGREQFESMFRQLSMNMRNTDMSNMFDKTINNMFKPFSYVESVVRYAQTMMLSDQGLSSNQILRRIHQTQFYNAPTWGAFNKLETIMPFITFRYNNMMYWMRMFDENPRYFRYFEDIYRNITDDTIESIEAQGSTIDYEDDFALRSGGIPIGAGHSYFNVNSSFLSAMNDFYVFPTDVDSLSPLLKDTVRLSMYALGLNSSKFFSEVDLDFSDDDFVQKMLNVIPGYSLARSGVKTFNNIKDQCSEDGGPSMSTLVSTLNFLGILGTRNVYTKNANFSFQDWRNELEAQGKWYDLNDGKIKDISEKNEYGANDPNNSFEDVQAYMLTHFGKIWDANQHKFVTMNDYIPGGWNDGFDWENDPEGAWENLQAYMREVGKIYDYNQRKFVTQKDYISGGLNDPNISWDKKLELMADYFPNLRWDANQNTFVDRTKYIEGGLNDLQGLEGQAFLSNFNKLKSYRLALFGETYDRASHKFVKTTDPMVVLPSYYTDRKTDHKYDRYFSLLGISRMQTDYTNYTVSSDGLLMTKDGKYVLTGISEHDTRIFDRVGSLYGYSGRRGRGYSGWKNYSYNKTQKPKKPYKGNPAFYQTGYGWNEEEGYYRLEYSQQYQYHSPQPASKVRRVIVPPKFYPYGGGYSKFSFYRR